MSDEEAVGGAAGQPEEDRQGDPEEDLRKAGIQAGEGSDGRGRRLPPGTATTVPGGPHSSPAALLTWGLVALVLVIVVVLVVVKLTSSSGPTASSGPQSQPIPAAIAQQVTGIPASVYNAVGVTSPTVSVTPPKAISGQPALAFDGKPGVFYLGDEFCAYCAAERWALVASLSRFGTLTGLGTMQSSSTDVFPGTQTFTFADAHLESPYVTLETREHHSNQQNGSGTGYAILQPLSKTQSALVSEYDTPKYTGAMTSGSVPFIDVGNRFLVAGSSFSPSILQGLTRTSVAADLSDAKDPVTQAIVASSNYLSASICSVDGEKPSSVCASSGVVAAAAVLGLKP